MPTLHWIGKEKVINHHLDVPYRVLEHQYTFSSQKAEALEAETTGNKIIHGDNLEALKALLPEYEGKIKCIYIDPPYNTGNEAWVYNDNVNDPKIKKWLGQVVGKEAEDLTRHDKWLCMMYPRLKLLHKLLAEDGAIFISIDDNELANLRLLMNEIFGSSNFIEYFSWMKTETPANLSIKTKKAIEYILCFQKKNNNVKFRGLEKESNSSNGLMNQTNSVSELVFPKNLIDTSLKDDIYEARVYGTKSYEIELLEETEVKNGIFIKPIRLKGKFKWSQNNLDKEILNGTKVSIRTIAFSPSYEKAEYEPEVPWNIIDKDFGVDTNENASTQLKEIFNEKIFDFPKTPSLIQYLINFLCDKNSIILDSFAGSGTTAHAVLNLNKQDGGNRKFICIEMEDYAETITAERVKRVINGYGSTGSPQAEGTGGSFDYYELGPALFNADNEINELVGVEKLRQYIYYTETKGTLTSLSSAASVMTSSASVIEAKKDNDYLLNKHNDTAYYFYYEQDGVTTLNHDFLSTIKTRAEQYVIYADNCLLTKEFMTKHHIIFKKIPRDITKF
jgi:adenine-specific DNA-methyltransferase